MGKPEYVIGQKFGMLTIIADAPKMHKARRVRCVCECGAGSIKNLTNLKTGHTKSCGCEAFKLGRNKTHGLTKSTEYKSYRKMIERCYDINDISYHNYGGRGISVCSRWRRSFENFIADMGMKPHPRMSLDRIDTNGNYEPSNCRWLTQKEQCNNKRGNLKLEYNGEVLNQVQWAERLGVPYSKIARHLKNGFKFNEIVEYIVKNGVDKIQMKPPSRKWWPRKKQTP
jgi:hypothetical protein